VTRFGWTLRDVDEAPAVRTDWLLALDEVIGDDG